MEEFIPDMRTVLYITTLPGGVPSLTENYVMFYLGAHGVYVNSFLDLGDKRSVLVKASYADEDALKSMMTPDCPMRIRRVFKHAVYNTLDDLEVLNGLFAQSIANLTGLLNGRGAVIKVVSDSKSIRDKFVKMAMGFAGDVRFDLVGENVTLSIKKIEHDDRIWVIIWVEGLDEMS